jgi:hypothetical protein
MAHSNSNRNSPHLSTHLNGSAPSSPSMSNAQNQQQQQQQPAGQPRQQAAGYPSPTSYPSPSLSGAQYSYPPPNNQQQVSIEPHRDSPPGSSGSLSLPSMRSWDSFQQQQHNMGSSLPPPVAQMGSPFYHGQGQNLPPPSQYPNVTSDPIGANMRYALPLTDSRPMSGNRHKKVSSGPVILPSPQPRIMLTLTARAKEIKRRTKTGCLTCRKRRIKVRTRCGFPSRPRSARRCCIDVEVRLAMDLSSRCKRIYLSRRRHMSCSKPGEDFELQFLPLNRRVATR